MGRTAQKVILMASVLLMLGGCSLLPSVKSTELTFAGTDVMFRGVEQITTSVEYYDETAKAVKVKKAKIDPPFWIVSEKFLNDKIGGGSGPAQALAATPKEGE